MDTGQELIFRALLVTSFSGFSDFRAPMGLIGDLFFWFFGF